MSWTFMQSFSLIPLMASDKKIYNVMNIYAKFQLHPPYGFWEEDFLIFFSKI